MLPLGMEFGGVQHTSFPSMMAQVPEYSPGHVLTNGNGLGIVQLLSGAEKQVVFCVSRE